MFIEIFHPRYRGVELAGESLIIHSTQEESSLLQDKVQDLVVAVKAEIVQIAAFQTKADHAWFFRGDKSLQRERIELGQNYGGGGKLIMDGAGRSHLFYFAKQSPGHSALLKHQVFDGQWSSPMTVSTNVFADPSSFGAAWHSDLYLHIVYCNYQDRHLFYRVFNAEHRVWSGAVPFSKQPGSNPWLISGEQLYLFWLQENGATTLNVRQKNRVWSEAQLISSPQEHAANVGFALRRGMWFVYWREKNNLYEAPFSKWSERKGKEAAQYRRIWTVEGGITIPAYQAKEVHAPEPEAPLSPESGVEPTAETQDELQSTKVREALLEEIERALAEWKTLRAKIRRWRAETAAPGEAGLPLFTNRLERLERRVVVFRQSQEQREKSLEGEIGKLQQATADCQQRLQKLEASLKAEQKNFLSRLLRKG